MVRMPSAARRACIALPTPQISPTGCSREEGERLASADHREAARLLEVGGDLGEELVEGEADRDGDADLVLDPPREPGEAQRRRRAVQPLGAGKVEKGLVDRERLDQRRQLEHQRRAPRGRRAAYFSMLGGMTTASGQAFSAWNIGIAERTPRMRAM